MTEHWRKGMLSEVPPEGKVDLAALFVLRSERLVRQKGRMGLVVSRSSLYVNKACKNVRERFFDGWGLEESCSFVNHLKLFEIDSRVEFSLLVGSAGGASRTPRFVHALVDPNTLDVVSRNIEVKDVSKVQSGPKPIELNLKMIKSYFSKDNLSIPGITDPRQLEIAEALHRASGPVTYLDQIEGVAVQKGINQTTGPRTSLSQYTEKIPAHELPKWEDLLEGKIGKWVPLYRGRDFDLFKPCTSTNPIFNRYSKSATLLENDIDLSRPTIFWRDISQVQNRRTFVSCIPPSGVWCDDTVWAAQFQDSFLQEMMCVHFSSICIDFLSRLTGSMHLSASLVNALPVALYRSNALKEALNVASSNFSARKKQIMIDALVFIHFGQGKDPLGRRTLEWIISDNFSCLNKLDSEYLPDVLSAYDWFTGSNSKLGGIQEYSKNDLIHRKSLKTLKK
jgi:hypothetical protein